MTQPLDRVASLPAIGEIDKAAGEFWIENPFQMQEQGVNLSAFERNAMYLSSESGARFFDISFASNADIESDSRAAIPADFDRDGRVDLLVCSVGGGPLRLFLNRFSEDANRVMLNLQGVKSNRSAIGARATLYCGERRIVRDLFPANGFMGQAPAELLIGLANAERIDRLEIRWPTGETQEFKDLPVNAKLNIVEGQDSVKSTPF